MTGPRSTSRLMQRGRKVFEASGDLPDFVEDQKERRLLTVLIDGRDVDPHRFAVWRHASHTFIDDAVAVLRDNVDCAGP